MLRTFYFLLCSILILPLLSQEPVSGGTYFQAVDEYKIGNYSRSTEILRKMNEEGKGTFETYALLGYGFDKMNDFDNAALNFAEARRRNPISEKIAVDSLALYIKFKKWKPGMELAEKFVSNFPTNGDIRFYYAITLQQRGAGKVALGQIEKAKTQNPNDARYLELEGKIYQSLKSFDKAEMSLRWASTLNQNSPTIWNNLALVQEAQFKIVSRIGKKSEANSYLEDSKKCIEKAEELDPTSDIIRENAKRIKSISSQG